MKKRPGSSDHSIDSSSISDKGVCSEKEFADGQQNGRKRLSRVLDTAIGTTDIEKGPPIAATSEHVVLTVQGMTCAGCETKLLRSCRDIPSMTNVQICLVLARCEFDIDLAVLPTDSAIAQLEKATGFKCERYHNQELELDVIVPGDSRAFLNNSFPTGVCDMLPVSKDTLRIFYDPKVIGTRDLVRGAFATPLQLAPLQADPALAAGSRQVRRVGMLTLLSAFLTVPVLIMAWAPLPEHPLIYGSLSLALATIIQVVVAGPFYIGALKALIFSHMIEMDLLVVLSTTAAYVFSLVAFAYSVQGKSLSTGEFFETSTLLVTLIMVGDFISALARQKAVESISIRSLQPASALVAENGQLVEIDARLLQYGDVFHVAHDSRIATDGIVISGTSEVDESMMTGESTLVEKKEKSVVIAGSINNSGTLDVQVTRLPGDNTISSIASMVDQAKLSKPKIQDLADVVAGYFVPAIAILSTITFLVWVAVGIAVRKQQASNAVVTAVTYAIATLIISCPCAIGLAVPMVIVIAGGVAADHGLIFKTAQTIETARKTTHVVFDKTGTLTEGKLTVQAEHYFEDLPQRTKELILSLCQSSKHPAAVALTIYLRSSGITAAAAPDTKSVPGKGIEGNMDGISVRIGSPLWLAPQFIPTITQLMPQNTTICCVTIGDSLQAIYGLQDTLRPDASIVVSSLIKRGISVSIVSGDGDGPVKSAASTLGIPLSKALSYCSPQDKQSYIQDLMSQPSTRDSNSGNRNTVIFIGDGTNDAPALATATIGIHVNESGTDIAQSAADAVLVRPALSGVLVLLNLSQAVWRRILFNFSWSAIYNISALSLAAGVGGRVRIPPAYAGLGELVSVLPVVVVAVALKNVKLERA